MAFSKLLTFCLISCILYVVKKTKMDYADYIIKDIKEKREFKQILDSIIEDGHKNNIKDKYKKYIAEY